MMLFRDVLVGWLVGRLLAPVFIVGIIGAALYSPAAAVWCVVALGAIGLLAALYLAVAVVVRVLDL